MMLNWRNTGRKNMAIRILVDTNVILDYILKREPWQENARQIILKDICKLFEIEGIDKHKLLTALDNKNFKDFEDCLQAECAKAFQSDYIVSRNLSVLKAVIFHVSHQKKFAKY